MGVIEMCQHPRGPNIFSCVVALRGWDNMARTLARGAQRVSLAPEYISPPIVVLTGRRGGVVPRISRTCGDDYGSRKEEEEDSMQVDEPIY